MLPKQRRLPSAAATSTAAAGTGVKPGSNLANISNWFSPALPASAGKFAATSCRHKTSKSPSLRASSTMRCGSTLPSTPRDHWIFQLISFTIYPLSLTNSGAHERLHELTLEQQERQQQRRRRHQRSGRDDGPVDTLVGGRKYLQTDRQRT